MSCDDMEVNENETVNRRIDKKRNLIFDGETYTFRPNTASSSDPELVEVGSTPQNIWYITKDKLKIDISYYPDDEWGYSK